MMKTNLKFAAEMPTFNSNETLIRDSKNLRTGLRARKNEKTVEIYLPVPK
jgi:hypothetical protein